VALILREHLDIINRCWCIVRGNQSFARKFFEVPEESNTNNISRHKKAVNDAKAKPSGPMTAVFVPEVKAGVLQERLLAKNGLFYTKYKLDFSLRFPC